MQFSVDRTEFLNALGKVQNIVERKSSMPILSHIRITAVAQHILIEATDLEVGFRGSFPARILQEGSLATSGRKLFEIARNLTSNEMLVEKKENNRVNISADEARFSLFGLSPEDFPDIPKHDHLKTVEMEADALRRMIHCTVFSSAAEDGFYSTSGVYVEKIPRDESVFLRMVATDGHRLSLMDLELENPADLEFEEGVVLSKKGVTEISRLVENDGTIRFGMSKSSGLVLSGSCLVAVRLLEGKFPNYHQVLAKGEQRIVELERKRFLEMLRRMSIMTSDRHKGVRLELMPDKLELSLNNPELGDAQEVMSVTYAGRIFKAAFNPKYLMDALSVMQSEQVSLSFSDEQHGCTIQGEADVGFLGLVMPMQLGG